MNKQYSPTKESEENPLHNESSHNLNELDDEIIKSSSSSSSTSPSPLISEEDFSNSAKQKEIQQSILNNDYNPDLELKYNITPITEKSNDYISPNKDINLDDEYAKSKEIQEELELVINTPKKEEEFKQKYPVLEEKEQNSNDISNNKSPKEKSPKEKSPFNKSLNNEPQIEKIKEKDKEKKEKKEEKEKKSKEEKEREKKEKKEKKKLIENIKIEMYNNIIIEK